MKVNICSKWQYLDKQGLYPLNHHISYTHDYLFLGADSLKLDWIEVRTDQKERIKCEFSTTFTNNEYYPDNCKKL